MGGSAESCLRNSDLAELVILSDLSQVPTILSWSRERRATSCFLTSSPAVAAELGQLGLQALNALDLLSPDELDSNALLAQELGERWWPWTWGEPRLLGLPLAALAKQEFALPFELALNARLAFGRLLENNEYRQITGFFRPPMGMCRTGPAPAFRPAQSITQGVLLWLAQCEGIPVAGLTTRRPLMDEGRQWRPPLTARDARRSVPPSGSEGIHGLAGRVVLLWKSGLWAQELAGLERALTPAAGWHLVALSARELNAVELPSDRAHLLEIEQNLAGAWRAYEDNRRSYEGPHAEIYGNPYLAFQFARTFAEMRTAARLGLIFNRLLNAFEPSLFLLGHDAFAIERTLVAVAKQSGIPTAALVHGGLQPHFGRLGVVGDADKVMVWGQEDYQALTRTGVNLARICVVGSVRFDESYYAHSLSCSKAPLPGTRASTGSTGRPQIVFLTAPTNVDIAQASASPRQHLATWHEIVSMVQHRQDWNFLIRAHPAYDFVDLYRQLCRKSPANLALSRDDGIEEVLQESHVAVLVNYCTTAALEATLAGIPVVFLRSATYDTVMREDSLGFHGALKVRSVVDLERTIDHLLTDQTYREQALDEARLMLKRVLGSPDRNALPKLLVELGALADRGSTHPTVSRAAANSKPRILEALNHLLQRSPGRAPETSCIETECSWSILQNLPLAIATATTKPNDIRASLRRLERICVTHFQLSPIAAKQLAAPGYLLAMLRLISLRHWRESRAVALYAIMEQPVVVGQTRAFVEASAKSILGANAWGRSLVNWIDRMATTSARMRPPRYYQPELNNGKSTEPIQRES